MFTIYLTEAGSTLVAKSDNFQLYKHQQLRWQVPIKSVQQIALFPDTHLSRSAQTAINSHQIYLLFIAEQGQLLVHLANSKTTPKKYLIRQKKRRQDHNFSRAFANSLLRAKLRQRQNILLQFLSSHQSVHHAINQIKLSLNNLPAANSHQALCTINNQASRLYNQAFNTLLAAHLSGPKSPNLAPIYPLLNLGYALLSQHLYRLIHQAELHCDYGHFHTNCTNHTPLVCDLMEQFRPLLVEQLILDIVHSHQLTAADFIPSPTNNQPYLSPGGLTKFIQAWEAKLQTPVHCCPTGQTTYAQLFQEQIQAYLAYLQGDTDSYRPLLLQ